jgi:hypothetical protein
MKWWPYSTIKELKKEIESTNEDRRIILERLESQTGEIHKKNKEIAFLKSEMLKKEKDFKRTIEFMNLKNLSK